MPPGVLIGLPLCGCLALACSAVQPIEATSVSAGGLVVSAASARRVEYLATQISAIRLTVQNTVTGQVLVYDDLAPTLISQKSGASYSFAVANLPAATYTVELTAFADAAETDAIGTSLSSPFTITPSATATVTVPNLTLDPTPTGAWTVTCQVQSALSGLQITGYSFGLVEIDGTSTQKSVHSSSTPQTHTWSNVLAYPTGVSTVSVTVNAKDKSTGQHSMTATAIGTASILSGATASTTLTVTF